jgi:membrane-bound ClpP family serine protease
MGITIIIILFALAYLLLLLELLVLPGIGIAGIGGLCLMIAAIWQVYAQYGTLAGNITLICNIVVSIILLWFALRAKTWNKAALKSEINSRADGQPTIPIAVGDKGTTVSRLAPMGKALIKNEYFEVCTFGELIDPSKEIEIVKIDHRKIYVQLIK